MEVSGPGFGAHGWWVGVVVGLAILTVAAGNWRRIWYLPLIPRLRGIDPSFIAGGQAGIGLAALVFSAAGLVADGSAWHTALEIAGYVCFVGIGFGTWAYGSYFYPDPDREG